ncbi:hypothetical protein ACX80U_09770 [Arthrobacter sp. TmT3-37]
MTLRDRGRVIAALGGVAALIILVFGIYVGITAGVWWFILGAVVVGLGAFAVYWDGKRKSGSNLGQPD